eukprot:4727757-Pleurochrysis_carterae.AAC.5
MDSLTESPRNYNCFLRDTLRAASADADGYFNLRFGARLMSFYGTLTNTARSYGPTNTVRRYRHYRHECATHLSVHLGDGDFLPTSASKDGVKTSPIPSLQTFSERAAEENRKSSAFLRADAALHDLSGPPVLLTKRKFNNRFKSWAL